MANIAELEYRIRQLVDYQRQLRTNKGPITLAPSPLTNGEGEGGEGGACRVKPLDLEAFRKRKLFVPGMLTPKSGKRLEAGEGRRRRGGGFLTWWCGFQGVPGAERPPLLQGLVLHAVRAVLPQEGGGGGAAAVAAPGRRGQGDAPREGGQTRPCHPPRPFGLSGFVLFLLLQQSKLLPRLLVERVDLSREDLAEEV